MRDGTPGGGWQLVESGRGNAGSMLLFETSAHGASGGPYYSLDRVEPIPWILSHFGEYALKVARMIGRTKNILQALGGPALGGVLLPLLAVSSALSTWRVLRALGACHVGQAAGRARSLRTIADGDLMARRLLLLALLGVSFVFFWATHFRARYFIHLLPLMLALGALELTPWLLAIDRKRTSARIAAGVCIVFFVAYPLIKGVELAYRDPHAFLGRSLASRFVSYETVTDDIARHVPDGATIMTPLAHEVAWYTGRPAVVPPGDEADADYLIDRFGIDAMYEHPGFPVSAATWRARGFEPVPTTNGRLWLRRSRQ